MKTSSSKLRISWASIWVTSLWMIFFDVCVGESSYVVYTIFERKCAELDKGIFKCGIFKERVKLAVEAISTRLKEAANRRNWRKILTEFAEGHNWGIEIFFLIGEWVLSRSDIYFWLLFRQTIISVGQAFSYFFFFSEYVDSFFSWFYFQCISSFSFLILFLKIDF